MSLDTKMYEKLVAAGGFSAVRWTEDRVTAHTQAFDPITREPVEPHEERYSISELDKQLEGLKAQVAGLEKFIADLKALPIAQPLNKQAKAVKP